jgi:hypothetical protein
VAPPDPTTAQIRRRRLRRRCNLLGIPPRAHAKRQISCAVLSISSERELPSTRPQVERFAKLYRARLTNRHFTAGA